MFFVTFIVCINNWSIIIEMFKWLYNTHYNKTNERSNNIPNIKELTRNDLVTYAHYHEHRMNAFQNI
jgi:hypothetical protein